MALFKHLTTFLILEVRIKITKQCIYCTVVIYFIDKLSSFEKTLQQVTLKMRWFQLQRIQIKYALEFVYSIKGLEAIFIFGKT